MNGPLKRFVQSVADKGVGLSRPYVALEHVESTSGVLIEGYDHEPRPADDSLLFEPGDTLFGKLRPYLAKVLRPTEPGCCSAEFLVLRPGSHVDSRFLYYLILSRPLVEWARATSYGTKMPRTNWESLGDLLVEIPSRDRQAAIADVLDRETARLDRGIQLKRDLLKKVEERFFAQVRQSILRGLDPTTGCTCGDDWPEDWGVAQLRSAVQLQRGHDLPTEQRRTGPIPVISSGGVSGYHDVPAALGPGVITGRYGTVGDVHWIDGPYWPLNTSLYVRDFLGNDARWAYYLLQALPLDIDAEKSAVTGINRNVVGKLRVPIPPVMEQRTIAFNLDHARASLEVLTGKLTRQVELLVEHRQALITTALTGQLDVA